MRGILTAAGWPEHLHGQALSVSWCESRWITSARNPHNPTVYGLFQLQQLDNGAGWGWFTATGEAFAQWSDPVVNARTAWNVYQYDVERGSSPWTQWECKP